MAQKSNNEMALEIWKKLSKAYDSVRKSHTRQISKHKLTAPQFGVLEVLQESGSMPLRRVSEELFVTGANITCVVDNLEKEDLVERIFSKEDRRVILADLTPKGKDAIKKIYPEYIGTLQGSVTNLSDNEQKQLVKLLNKLAG